MFVNRESAEEFINGITLFLEYRGIEEYLLKNPEKRDELLKNLSEYLKEEMDKYAGTDIGLYEIIVFSSRSSLRRLRDDVLREKHKLEK